VSVGPVCGIGPNEDSRVSKRPRALQNPERTKAVIFDLDGVLTDTAELHFLSWLDLARELDIPFDRQANEALRGLSREESLRVFLGPHAARFTPDQQAAIMARKNERYVGRLARLGPGDTLPGARELLAELRRQKVPVALASSSKNTQLVLERLGIRPLLDVVVDGNDVKRTKPYPDLFLLAAQRLGVAPARCVVIEDAESGVEAALAAGTKVVGVGPPDRVGKAQRVVPAVSGLHADIVLSLVGA
jgi:beta-phosphoglucomutase